MEDKKCPHGLGLCSVALQHWKYKEGTQPLSSKLFSTWKQTQHWIKTEKDK